MREVACLSVPLGEEGGCGGGVPRQIHYDALVPQILPGELYTADEGGHLHCEVALHVELGGYVYHSHLLRRNLKQLGDTVELRVREWMGEVEYSYFQGATFC